MNAYEVFLVATQPFINYLYICVISILPLLWLGDCKRTMSLLFKRIRLPDTYEISHKQIEFQPDAQIIILLISLTTFYLHRYWRMKLHNIRRDVLVQENAFTASNELSGLKTQLLNIINNLIQKNISTAGINVTDTSCHPIYSAIEEAHFTEKYQDVDGPEIL